MFLRKYWIPLSVFIVAIVGIRLYLLATQPPPEPVKIYKTVEPIEKPTQQPTPQAPVGGTSQGRHVHADGNPWHEGPHESEVPEILPTESESELIPPVSLETAVREAKVDEAPTKQAPYHPHDDLSPEEHQRVHADLKREQSKLDDLNIRYARNSAALKSGHITPDESLKFLKSASQELASIKANIKRLRGE